MKALENVVKKKWILVIMVKMERKKILIIKTLTKNKDTVKRLKINIQSGPLNINVQGKMKSCRLWLSLKLDEKTYYYEKIYFKVFFIYFTHILTIQPVYTYEDNLLFI